MKTIFAMVALTALTVTAHTSSAQAIDVSHPGNFTCSIKDTKANVSTYRFGPNTETTMVEVSYTKNTKTFISAVGTRPVWKVLGFENNTLAFIPLATPQYRLSVAADAKTVGNDQIATAFLFIGDKAIGMGTCYRPATEDEMEIAGDRAEELHSRQHIRDVGNEF